MVAGQVAAAESSIDITCRVQDKGFHERGTRLGAEMLSDIDKETVDWQPNYDDKELEPTVLPTKVPNLLINGSSGIAVGMATNFPPHNLTEIINATVALIQNPATPVAKSSASIRSSAARPRAMLARSRTTPTSSHMESSSVSRSAFKSPGFCEKGCWARASSASSTSVSGSR